jgi:5-methylcytosine-specific restriction protein B
VGAWLVRGANNQGVDERGENMLQQWFAEGFVSVGWPNAKAFPLDAEMPEIREALAATGARQGGELIRGSGIVKRVLSIQAGDLVFTPDGDALYVARATGSAYWAEGNDSSALRVPVAWLNVESPGSRAKVREGAPGLYSSLRTLLTVSDLKAHVSAIEAMLNGEGEADGGGPDPEPNGDSTGAVIPRASRRLADELFLTEQWLAEIIELLNEKRQVVFYGPPGTGKTFVAQALGRHVREMGGEFDLVQFHPAYSYEDFFEGYRPRLGAAGAVEFELRPGPLRRLADKARANPDKPHLLIVDEINRGNIAKIFGELYFLLEYRDRSMRLQYSSEDEFSLPDNLFVIGTMNTADRSIALVDSALRRRFYFVGFLPTEEPLRSVLGKWLDANGYEADAANYLTALNEALRHTAGGDDEFAIGPSYFITRDRPPDVHRVWRHALAPLLQERFFGARRLPEIEQEFSPSALGPGSLPGDE